MDPLPLLSQLEQPASTSSYEGTDLSHNPARTDHWIQEEKDINEIASQESTLLDSNTTASTSSISSQEPALEIANLRAQVAQKELNLKKASLRIIDLQAEVEVLERVSESQESENGELRNQLSKEQSEHSKSKDLLAKFGKVGDALAKVRIGWISNCVQYDTGKCIAKLYGVPDIKHNRAAIKARNMITHDGQWELDNLLGELKLLPPHIVEWFPVVYGSTLGQKFSPLGIKVRNMNGSMISYHAGSFLSSDKDDDSHFSEAWKAFWRLYEAAKKIYGNDHKAIERYLREKTNALALLDAMSSVKHRRLQTLILSRRGKRPVTRT
ncbi:uncharacterized protein LY89DRAFT_673171 [Mollisia scopiformis]|uniref:Uncharacterized protein n=1 Tax=Mollisia scopiformis TaxID=149040 RepID=A0A194WZN0_MOLSC|nr:uncharacterized protein LY89DRAFT_673171 [Mollisia scopiformis]KUJ13072.1 hypothetical protein LY89DRAFT_673171 [Mollisia scopiformis]